MKLGAGGEICIASTRAFVDLAKILGLINKSIALLEEIEKEVKKATSNRA
jgi:hypothetical protein